MIWLEMLAPSGTSASQPPRSFRVAPGKWNYDWKVLSPVLAAGADSEKWNGVVRDFYRGRLKSRYLDAINSIRNPRARLGEGFAIVALQCSLIEFLESCHQGMNYRHKKPVPPYEYNESGKIFVSFLTKRKPFSEHFDKDLAWDFYSSVRCGVLHEASTRGGWRIKAHSGSRIIDADERTVFRDGFQDALQSFIDDYCAKVVADAELQKAFIRKYDHLCQ